MFLHPVDPFLDSSSADALSITHTRYIFVGTLLAQQNMATVGLSKQQRMVKVHTLTQLSSARISNILISNYLSFDTEGMFIIDEIQLF